MSAGSTCSTMRRPSERSGANSPSIAVTPPPVRRPRWQDLPERDISSSVTSPPDTRLRRRSRSSLRRRRRSSPAPSLLTRGSSLTWSNCEEKSRAKGGVKAKAVGSHKRLSTALSYGIRSTYSILKSSTITSQATSLPTLRAKRSPLPEVLTSTPVRSSVIVIHLPFVLMEPSY